MVFILLWMFCVESKSCMYVNEATSCAPWGELEEQHVGWAWAQARFAAAHHGQRPPRAPTLPSSAQCSLSAPSLAQEWICCRQHSQLGPRNGGTLPNAWGGRAANPR